MKPIFLKSLLIMFIKEDLHGHFRLLFVYTFKFVKNTFQGNIHILFYQSPVIRI